MKKLFMSLILLAGIFFLIISALSMLFFASITSSDIDYQQVDMYRFGASNQLKRTLEEHDMEYRYANNDLEEYRSILDHLQEDDMLIYYDNLGITETNKICAAFGYADLDDFMIKKGYVDSEGKPSIGELRKASYKLFTEKSRK